MTLDLQPVSRFAAPTPLVVSLTHYSLVSAIHISAEKKESNNIYLFDQTTKAPSSLFSNYHFLSVVVEIEWSKIVKPFART